MAEERSLVDAASSFVLEYDFFALKLFVEDPSEGYTLLEDISLFTMA